MGTDRQHSGLSAYCTRRPLSTQGPPTGVFVSDGKRTRARRVPVCLHLPRPRHLRVEKLWFHRGDRGRHVPALPRRMAQLPSRRENRMGRILDRIQGNEHRQPRGQRLLSGPRTAVPCGAQRGHRAPVPQRHHHRPGTGHRLSADARRRGQHLCRATPSLSTVTTPSRTSRSPRPCTEQRSS